ncbi:hypothetical protein JB92DRAFT_2825122 [Gautieria morchelliformis]|nr:hypothetical protein JB92DRAFT_2825122 [Gautieria morchelliformis]
MTPSESSSASLSALLSPVTPTPHPGIGHFSSLQPTLHPRHQPHLLQPTSLQWHQPTTLPVPYLIKACILCQQGKSGDTLFQVVRTQDNGQSNIAWGPDCNGRQWLIVKKAPGTPLQFTFTWQASIKKYAADCQADLAQVINKIVTTAEQFVMSFGVMHNEPQPKNVFFA